MKKFIVVISLLAVLSFSCKDEEEDGDLIDAKDVTTKKTFYVQNSKTGGTPVSVEAGIIAEGKNCHVWVGRGASANVEDQNNKITKEKAQNVANIYDDKIYKKMMDNFSFTKEDGLTSDSGAILNNTLEVVKDIVKDGDGKLNIVLVDIPDNYEKGKNNAYTAGYFWSGDLLEKNAKNPYSNECAAIFIDTYPGIPGSDESNSTLAHELQHLMSFLNGIALERNNNFETWIDEGLSLSAEYLYQGKQVTSRINHYKNDPSGLIKKGNNFYVWDNRDKENQYAVLDDYATVYLFFQWLRLQTNQTIFKQIEFSGSSNYEAVLDEYNYLSSKKDTWDSLLKTWLASNRINAGSGPYGYKNESELSAIKAPFAPKENKSFNLYPGEGVYSKSPTSAQTASGNIMYAYLSESSVSDTYSAATSDALLTYNKNTSLGGSTEPGITTGVAASEETVPDARFMAAFYNEPIRIDAGDMMGRDKWRESFSNVMSELKKKGVKDE